VGSIISLTADAWEGPRVVWEVGSWGRWRVQGCLENSGKRTKRLQITSGTEAGKSKIKRGHASREERKVK
jgi:hypothetical protein